MNNHDGILLQKVGMQKHNVNFSQKRQAFNNGINGILEKIKCENIESIKTIIDNFIKKNVDLNTIYNSEGLYILHILCKVTDFDVRELIKLVIENGANVNLYTHPKFAWSPYKKMSPLHVAIYSCKTQYGEAVIQLLINNGANLNFLRGRWHVLHSVFNNRYITDYGERIIQMIYNENTKFDYNLNSLYYDWKISHLICKVCDIICEKKRCINYRKSKDSIYALHEEGNTLLHLYCRVALQNNCLNIDIAEQMLKCFTSHNFDLNAKNKAGQTALHTIISYNYDYDISAIVLLLIKYGIDPNILDNFGSTALHYCCQYYMPISSNNKKVIEILIKAGTDQNIRDINDKTAIEILKSSYRMLYSDCISIDINEIIELFD